MNPRPSSVRDPWFDALRPKRAFGELVERCAVRHVESVAAFDDLDGRAVLGMSMVSA
jgi:hypothetical protein